MESFQGIKSKRIDATLVYTHNCFENFFQNSIIYCKIFKACFALFICYLCDCIYRYCE